MGDQDQGFQDTGRYLCQVISLSHFIRAIQLHPMKPIFWIMAASWEFTENSNMSSARSNIDFLFLVLMQRGIRLNPNSQRLWHEYFKLELLYIAKIKERRKVLLSEQKDELSGFDEPEVKVPELTDEIKINKVYNYFSSFS